jgi:hypothetical protein
MANLVSSLTPPPPYGTPVYAPPPPRRVSPIARFFSTTGMLIGDFLIFLSIAGMLLDLTEHGWHTFFLNDLPLDNSILFFGLMIFFIARMRKKNYRRVRFIGRYIGIIGIVLGFIVVNPVGDIVAATVTSCIFTIVESCVIIWVMRSKKEDVMRYKT